MAILLHEEGIYDKTRIYATDINKSILEKAKQGTFPLEGMKLYTKNYIEAGGKQAFSEYYQAIDDKVCFHPFLQKNMVFAQHNVVSDHSFNEFDMIICRNVLIYFNKNLQNNVHQLIYESLSTPGFLGLGKERGLNLHVMKTVTENLMDPKGSIEKLNNTPPQKVNILMVDDHPENLLAIEAVLTSPNYNLISANSGNEALKCMLQHDFAVILLDVQMPGLNGFDTAKLIKAREKTKNIPIIFITAISQDMEHVHQGYSVGAIDYIFKPFHPETLKKKIEQFVKIHQIHGNP